jgi:feruloyl-CoA synthase
MQSLPWSELVATKPTARVVQSIVMIEPETVGKLLFTSGSTGMPKAVINTQKMMCANLSMGQMARVRRPTDPPAVMLDWLPWNHTMGGNATFQGNLADGGTTYIDDGGPVRRDAAQSSRTVADLLRKRTRGLRHAGDGARER